MRTPSESVKRQLAGTAMPRAGRTIPAADLNQVLREQLDFLIAHAADHSTRGCTTCERYQRVRSELLRTFRD